MLMKLKQKKKKKLPEIKNYPQRTYMFCDTKST